VANNDVFSQLNTSAIGQNIFHLNGSDSSSDSGGSSIWSDIGSDIENDLNKVKNKVESELNDITGDVADDLAKDLGLSEWYSVHVMDACEGMYKPNATAHHPGLNVTNCTSSQQNSRFPAFSNLKISRFPQKFFRIDHA
jgi:hypothetical protein